MRLGPIIPPSHRIVDHSPAFIFRVELPSRLCKGSDAAVRAHGLPVSTMHRPFLRHLLACCATTSQPAHGEPTLPRVPNPLKPRPHHRSRTAAFCACAVLSVFFAPQGFVVRLALALGFVLFAQEFIPDEQVGLFGDLRCPRSSPSAVAIPLFILTLLCTHGQTCIVSKKKVKVIRHDVSLATISAPVERINVYTTPGARPGAFALGVRIPPARVTPFLVAP